MTKDDNLREDYLATSIREELGECMPIDIWYDGDIWVFRPFGRIDTGHSADLDNALSEGVSQGMRQIVLDLTDTSYISSSGLRAIIKAAKAVKADRGSMSLCGMNETVQEVFRLTGLLKQFPSYQTAQEAIVQMTGDRDK